MLSHEFLKLAGGDPSVGGGLSNLAQVLFQQFGQIDALETLDMTLTGPTDRQLDIHVCWPTGELMADQVRGQTRKSQPIPGFQDVCALDDVLQLTQVAGPRVGGEDAEDFGVGGPDGLSVLTPQILEEGVYEHWYVFGALAQGRKVDGKDVEAVEEVAAEKPLVAERL